jgi:hypothetical protein
MAQAIPARVLIDWAVPKGFYTCSACRCVLISNVYEDDLSVGDVCRIERHIQWDCEAGGINRLPLFRDITRTHTDEEE